MLDYALVKMRITAVFELPSVDGAAATTLTVNDVVAFNSMFAVNTIPTAMLSLAVGHRADTTTENSPDYASIYTIADNLTQRAKVRVYLESEVLSSMGVRRNVGAVGSPTTVLEFIGVPPGKSKLLIFEGNVSGIGRSVSTAGTAVATVYLEHWLANLNYASAISVSSNPGNPDDMVFSAVFRARNTVTQSGLGTVTWVPAVMDSFVNVVDLSDIWGNVFHKWMGYTAEDDPFTSDLRRVGINNNDADVDPIKDAISRLAPGNSAGVPLALDISVGADSAAISDGIRTSLMMQTGTNWVNTTLWGKLIGEWSPSFWFSVIPRVSDGLVVPTTGPLSGKPWAVIGSEDYVFVQSDFRILQALRGVAIIHSMNGMSGYNGTAVGNTLLPYTGFAGEYISKTVTAGMLLIKSPPAWLSNPVSAVSSANRAEGGGNTVVTALDAIPDGGAQVAGVLDADTIGKRIDTARGFLDKYAQQWYAFESLKGRTGEVAGKVRFDICPGSNILLEGSVSPVGANTLVGNLCATVLQVNYMFDVERQQAGTSFILSHVHTESEHDAPTTVNDIVVDEPPMYTAESIWRGAGMFKTGTIPET